MNALNFNGDRIEKLTLTSDDGKVVYSWRVTILPMLEQYAIYNKIDFNQPWDSEKNRELFKTEIEMYKNDYAKTPGTTTWKMIPKFRGGVMLVEGGEGSAVPWAPHDEVKLDGDDPLVSFGKEPAGGYRVVMSDGSAKRMAGADLKELLKKPQ